ncbi:16S rRNA (guanine(966)-N(2))-methyltransferase RsmD [bacterium CG_4_10_14_0_2_um_filter_33_32]|nr:MAG: 16S rRNA (guanine(966)-N(2))-methyltransferase RsmD [bacterium CG2_30_33_46]PIR67227.1 MAG: 16S rRNA (guanine(966)-N(2))-methyltransferase RsmD [bacterium CG10_big_fil_rev_8_21_14_0_10_33_18]PIU77028.1 MAG: 16S rRNA (guanine(966)-N(2))-methyltransferase RsmD [bacterium CG06_land_8_20_14_3_00_33_50]PIW81334.1 MAG: 16S rRNA (guanine(966)-N(2))-methyltransferase RsmD [bacterium CG_4_8_14_3_um_filter_33_28]PIY85164.1 MAG: 16S rRNA (guanine(966)-N(2))-methyltransferase RsmD [bacterium CG_4_1
MRIISGIKKGFIIKGPPTVRIENLKPMPDKVRESIFNILGGWIEEKQVLDLYAGTGAVGLEALSRGAVSVEFVENNKKTSILIKENLEKLGFTERVYQEDAHLFVNHTGEAFDLIFITPPHKEIDFKVVEAAGKKLKPQGIIVLESDSRTEVPLFENLKQFDQRIYGRLKITFLQSK